MHSRADSPAFDRMSRGTREEAWQRLLAASPAWSPPGGPLLIVTLHPDEEVLGAGGLIHSSVADGRLVTVLSVSDGEAAYPDWAGLGSVRREELQAALRKLCPTHVPVSRLGLPDGDVRHHENRLRNAILAACTPETTLVAPFERDGHPDREAVGRICCDIARVHALLIARYPIAAWHGAQSALTSDLRWGRFVLAPEAQRAKARALQCFASQIAPRDREPVVPRHVLEHFDRAYEAFVL